MMHIHLDPLGGISGDMFVAAMLDAFPEIAPSLISFVNQVGGGRVKVSLEPVDAPIAGNRFQVFVVPESEVEYHDHQKHKHGDGIKVAAIYQLLDGLKLPDSVAKIARGIYSEIARSESEIHRLDLASIHLHELGGWDSIIDIAAAAFMIDAVGPASWSLSSLPWGGGAVSSDHGILPCPAPATLKMLEGYLFHNDGIVGERVTPTGAAIVKWLAPSMEQSRHTPFRIQRTGYGFGSRHLAGTANVLRAAVSEVICASEAQVFSLSDALEILFDIDDQPTEDLAIALDHLREYPGVLDILQRPAFGKKGRLVVQVQLLIHPEAQSSVLHGIFAETTTLGVRIVPIRRATLMRREDEVTIKGREVAVKWARRPGGETIKVEAESLRSLTSFRERFEIRAVVDGLETDDD